MSARILYTIRIYEGGLWDVEQHQRSLNPMKDVIIHPERIFPDGRDGAKIRLTITTGRHGGKLILNDPPKKGGLKMRRISWRGIKPRKD